MPGATRRTILISELQDIDNRFPFFPYVWAILKSYWERHGSGTQHYEWLEPLWQSDVPATMLQPYASTPIDVLGLSCYTWNWPFQCELAQYVKARQPHCLVIAGGPEPDYKDPDFFRKHPYIDMVAVKDGEITFTKILTKLLQGNRDFHDIGGLYLPAAHEAGHICTGPAEVPVVFDHSPYLEQHAYYERLVEQGGPGSFQAIWETNRGCPYSCSYCDWGSSTMSKIRRFDMQRIEAEADWLGRMKTRFIFQADANFGILPRDIDIADLLNAARQKYGYPGAIYYSSAKNNPDRALTIAKKFAQSGLARVHALSIQHTRQEVLAATERSNISPAKQVEVVQALMAERIPIDVQLILGIPGDTYELWKGCLADLMEWGIHEDYQAYTYQLLPNAPAAEQPFVEHWHMQTIERFVTDNVSRKYQEKGRDLSRKSKSRIVVESKTYTRADWVKMFTYTAFIKALHNAGATRYMAVYLRCTHQVPYLEFYEAVIEDCLAQTAWGREWYAAVQQHYERFLASEDTTEHMEVTALPHLPYALDPSRWLYVQLCLQAETFFDALKAYLLARYPTAMHLASVIDYQQHMLILPTYDRDVGKTFATDCHWPQYFEAAQQHHGSVALDEPACIPGALVEVSDRTARGIFLHQLDWNTSSPEGRWNGWVEHLVLDRNSIVLKHFQQVQVEAPALAL